MVVVGCPVGVTLAGSARLLRLGAIGMALSVENLGTGSSFLCRRPQLPVRRRRHDLADDLTSGELDAALCGQAVLVARWRWAQRARMG